MRVTSMRTSIYLHRIQCLLLCVRQYLYSGHLSNEHMIQTLEKPRRSGKSSVNWSPRQVLEFEEFEEFEVDSPLSSLSSLMANLHR